jgi:uncharacterized membrane protein
MSDQLVHHRDPRSPLLYERGSTEYSRAVNFLDATFAIAMTLLVTTLAGDPDKWASWSAFRQANAGPLFAYVLSFIVVGTFWWANHRAVGELRALSPRLIAGHVLSLGFIVLLPFATAGLGSPGGSTGQVPTVVYALDVAAISIANFVCYRAALAGDLFLVGPTAVDIRQRTIELLDTPVVFLASIPVTILVSPRLAYAVWFLLLPIGIMTDRRFRSRVASPSG